MRRPRRRNSTSENVSFFWFVTFYSVVNYYVDGYERVFAGYSVFHFWSIDEDDLPDYEYVDLVPTFEGLYHIVECSRPPSRCHDLPSKSGSYNCLVQNTAAENILTGIDEAAVANNNGLLANGAYEELNSSLDSGPELGPRKIFPA